MQADELSPKAAEEHLKSGGTFLFGGGAMRVMFVPGAERYLLINDSGNGADHVQPRLTSTLDLMEQYAGGDLAAWDVVPAEQALRS